VSISIPTMFTFQLNTHPETPSRNAYPPPTDETEPRVLST
jgi:hypothetical protein